MKWLVSKIRLTEFPVWSLEVQKNLFGRGTRVNYPEGSSILAEFSANFGFSDFYIIMFFVNSIKPAHGGEDLLSSTSVSLPSGPARSVEL